jgi:arsenate reductase
MAEAVLNRKGGGRFVAESAGSQPAARVNPLAIEALKAIGIDWSGHAPRGLDGLTDREYDIIITVCDRAREACPIFPGRPMLAHWGMADPAEVEGDEAGRRRAFWSALQLITRRIDLLVALPAASMERMVLEQKVRAIGSTD